MTGPDTAGTLPPGWSLVTDGTKAGTRVLDAGGALVHGRVNMARAALSDVKSSSVRGVLRVTVSFSVLSAPAYAPCPGCGKPTRGKACVSCTGRARWAAYRASKGMSDPTPTPRLPDGWARLLPAATCPSCGRHERPTRRRGCAECARRYYREKRAAEAAIMDAARVPCPGVGPGEPCGWDNRIKASHRRCRSCAAVLSARARGRDAAPGGARCPECGASSSGGRCRACWLASVGQRREARQEERAKAKMERDELRRAAREEKKAARKATPQVKAAHGPTMVGPRAKTGRQRLRELLNAAFARGTQMLPGRTLYVYADGDAFTPTGRATGPGVLVARYTAQMGPNGKTSYYRETTAFWDAMLDRAGE